MASTSDLDPVPSRAIMLPDILTLIFEYLAIRTDHVLPRRDRRTPCSEWLPVINTCRTWRRVAISTTRIWCYIWTALSPSLAWLFLQRSKAAPLYLWSCNFESNRQTVSMVLHHTHLHRLKEVEIMDCDQHVWFKTLLENPAPQLEVLTLCGSTPWNNARCCFSTNALHDGAPALRKLHIFGFSFELDPRFLSNLTHLNLSFCGNGRILEDMDRFSPYELLVALQGMPHLQKLTLGAVLEPEYEIPTLEDGVGVNLLGLTYLEFDVEFMVDFQILHYLAFPSIKSIVLRCDEVADPADISVITPILHGLLPPHDSSLTHTAVVIESSGSKLYSKPESRTTIKLEAGPTEVPPVKLKLALVGANCFQCEDFLETSHPLLDSIDTLDFDGYAEAQDGKDPSIFASFFHAVTTTELRVSGLADILFALASTPKRPREDGQPLSYPLPNLQTISLFQQRDPKDTRRLVGCVKRLLLERKALGAAVDVLEVVLKRGHKTTAAYKITPQDLEPLTGILEVVFLP